MTQSELERIAILETTIFTLDSKINKMDKNIENISNLVTNHLVTAISDLCAKIASLEGKVSIISKLNFTVLAIVGTASTGLIFFILNSFL